MSDKITAGAQGALGGMGTGAALGTTILPGLGTVLGAAIGGIAGGISGANKKGAQEDALAQLNAIPAVDPLQVEFKDQLLREKRMVESGFTTDFQVAKDLIGKSEAGGMSVAASLAQTNPALALMMMSQVGAGTDTAVNKALGTIGARGSGYLEQVGGVIDRMSQRKIQVELLKAQYGLGIATKELQDFNANSLAGMMKLADPSTVAGFKSIFGKTATVAGAGFGNPAAIGNIDVPDTSIIPTT